MEKDKEKIEKILENSSRMTYFSMEGIPISLIEWSLCFEDLEKRTIGRDNIGKYHVSTVWLGLNHNFFGDPPLIFETMIFCDDEKDDLYCWQDRYSTKEQALKGHQEAVKLCLKEVENLSKNETGKKDGK